MKLKSLIENGRQLEIAEVEIEFIPGIPQIHFLGLPDRIIKESFYRIKSALKSSGYKFPLTQQMIVNIKPSHLRKSSRGVELAVAIGILIKTKQIRPELVKPEWVIYGELGLDGSVYEPSDLNTHFFKPKDIHVLTGWSKLEMKHNHFRLHELKNFEVFQNVIEETKNFKRPDIGLTKLYSKEEAEFLFLVAATGLHGLLAGDAGAGKSTLAKSVISFLSEPSDEQTGRWRDEWRPVIMPHQSVTPAAFLGGGSNLYQGEIERVENGLLILDELLEFNTEIVEALRGPMVGETLRLVRGSEEREIKPSFQVVATTNLCRCGKWTPLKKDISCRYSRTQCGQKLEKLSGPFVDRFGLLLYVDQKVKRSIPGENILKRVEKVRLLLQKAKIAVSPSCVAIRNEYFGDYSTRRQNFLDRAAAVLALDRASEKSQAVEITIQDFNRAEEWVIKPFLQLERGMS